MILTNVPRLTGFSRQEQRSEFRTDLTRSFVLESLKFLILQVRLCKVLTTSCRIEVYESFARFHSHSVHPQWPQKLRPMFSSTVDHLWSGQLLCMMTAVLHAARGGCYGGMLLSENPSQEVLNEIDIWFFGGLVINVTLPECSPMIPSHLGDPSPWAP